MSAMDARPAETGTSAAPVALRFRDVDAFGHVYHAEYLTLLDEARTGWLRDVVGLEHPSEYVVARLEIDYLSSLVPADRSVAASIGVERMGTTSLTLRETLCADDGRAVSRSRTVIVLRDPRSGGKRALSEAERERAERVLLHG
jgi:acyl-CoA thioester hydrolase